MSMTPAERARAYYHAHKTDPVWVARQKALRQARRPKRPDPVEGRWTPQERLREALVFMEDKDSYWVSKTGVVENAAYAVWQYYRFIVASGLKPPFHPLDRG